MSFLWFYTTQYIEFLSIKNLLNDLFVPFHYILLLFQMLNEIYTKFIRYTMIFDSNTKPNSYNQTFLLCIYTYLFRHFLLFVLFHPFQYYNIYY